MQPKSQTNLPGKVYDKIIHKKGKVSNGQIIENKSISKHSPGNLNADNKLIDHEIPKPRYFVKVLPTKKKKKVNAELEAEQEEMAMLVKTQL